MAYSFPGKTTIAATLFQVFAEQSVWMPFAVEVDGQIITVYDPVIHRKVQEDRRNLDERWGPL